MLPAVSRLRRRQDFGLVMRRGRRSGRSRLVVHALLPEREEGMAEAVDATQPTPDGGLPSRVGFVVSKAVGNSVVRHRVSRRLRHLLGPRLAELPSGSQLVVRALPPAADATSAELAADLDAALRKLRRTPRGPSS
ncbi:ribonuclease P protein component [Allokutzneria albata]|uniref:Ribonuclease P protein component n=1 Tax=Allokutzneria albata TaxID=211114 RepID=A0A1G9ZXM2_ALLAB|nr:ribonuclease P protein component [Allokutzneria albata]SDN26018.1 ribonuclease P protein component [Allokutzneria albata]